MCEIALALGGRTVEELKWSMTYDEVMMWEAYRDKRGTLNEGMRLEWLFARLSHQISSALGGKPNFKQILRYHDTIGGGMESMDFAAAAKMARDSVEKAKKGGRRAQIVSDIKRGVSYSEVK